MTEQSQEDKLELQSKNEIEKTKINKENQKKLEKAEAEDIAMVGQDVTVHDDDHSDATLVQYTDLPHENDTDDVTLNEFQDLGYNAHHSKKWNDEVNNKALQIENEMKIEENMKKAEAKAKVEAKKKAE